MTNGNVRNTPSNSDVGPSQSSADGTGSAAVNRGSKHKDEESKSKAQPKLSSPRLVFLKQKIKSLYTKGEHDLKSVCGKHTCKNIKLFVAIYALLFFTRGALRQYMTNILEHIHREFSLTSHQLTFIMGVEKIGFVVTIIFAAYYGNKLHKPIAIFTGAMLCALGVILCAVPYFLQESRSSEIKNENWTEIDIPFYYDAGLCQVGRNMSTSLTQCEVLTIHGNRTETFSLLSVGNFATGIGTAFFFTLGFMYIEESSSKDVTPIYYGTVLCLNGLGEMMGLVAAWQFTTLSQSLPGVLDIYEWHTGAWWLGFPILAILFLILPFPLLFYPKWILLPEWVISRRKRKLNKLLKLLREEEKALKKLARREKRRKQKLKEKQKKKLEKSNESNPKTVPGPSVELPEETSQDPQSTVHKAFVSSEEESPAIEIHDLTDGHTNGHIDSSQVTTDQSGEAAEPVDSGDEEDEADNAIDGHPEEMEDQFGSDLGLAHQLTEESNGAAPDTNRHNQQVRFSVIGESSDLDGGLDLASGPAPARGHVDVDIILQSEEPEAASTPAEDSLSLKSDKSNTSSSHKKRYQLGRKLQDLPRNLWFLINRPVFILTLVATIFGAYNMAGFHPSTATYMDTQFPMYSPSHYMVAGIPYTFGMMVGSFVAGLVLYKYSLKVMDHVKILLVLQSIVCVLMVLMVIPNCQAGYFFDTPTYKNTLSSIKQACNLRCDCSGTQYDRICSRDGVAFPSGCHAGCRNIRRSEDQHSLVYDQCSCQPDVDLSSAYCDQCIGPRVGYGVLVCLVSVAQSAGCICLILVFLRCVSQKLRSLALGFATWITYIGAFVPGTAVYGSFQSVSCAMYRPDCSEDDVCWHYNLSTYRYLQNGAAAGLQFMALLFLLVVFLVLRHRRQLAARTGNNTVSGGRSMSSGADNGAFDKDIKESRGISSSSRQNKPIVQSQSINDTYM